MLRFQATNVVHAENATPLSWSFNNLSPFLKRTDSSKEVLPITAEFRVRKRALDRFVLCI